MSRKRDHPAAALDRRALERIADVFRIFSEPTRLAIFQALKEEPKNVSTLVAETESSQANVSRQLRVLHDAGFLVRVKDGNKVYYSIKEALVFEICELVCNKLNRDAESPEVVGFSR